MPTFSAASKVRITSCRSELQAIANEAIKSVGFSCLEGHRGEEAQNKAFREGHSQKQWPEGDHNALPSNAYDLLPDVPEGMDAWNVNDPAVQLYWWRMIYALLRAAEKLGYRIRWGNDWNSDGNTADTKLKDWPHVELAQ